MKVAEVANEGRLKVCEGRREGRVKVGGWWSRGLTWLSQWGALILIWPLAGALGAAGFAVSFTTVEKEMKPHFDELAWLVPAATDLGIIVFTLLDIVLARRSMRIPWMRYIPWALTAATIYLNVTAYTALEAQVAHAVLPSLWVVFSEAIARVMKLKAKEEFQVSRTVPLIRWVCAPWATFILWRSMQLWNIGTYDEALVLEEERQLAKAIMRDRFGSVRKAKPELRVRYRQRKITVVEVYAAAGVKGAFSERSVRRDEPSVVHLQPDLQSPSDVQSASVKPVQSRRSTPKRRGRASDVQSASADTGKTVTKREALASAWADFQAEGVVMPTVKQLAERAGCSTGLASSFRKQLTA